MLVSLKNKCILKKGSFNLRKFLLFLFKVLSKMITKVI